MVADTVGSPGRLAFRILGPLEVFVDGAAIPLAAEGLRVVLGRLLVACGRAVHEDALAEAAWDGEPPSNFKNPLQVRISKLRGTLWATDAQGKDQLRRVATGYRLNVGSAAVDFGVFTELLADADGQSEAGRLAEASQTYTAALKLIVGRPLDDLKGRIFADEFAQKVATQRASTIVKRARCDMFSGRADAAIPVLRQRVDANLGNPDEALWLDLIRALYLADRQSEALARCAQLRGLLGSTRGLDPSPKISELEKRILRQESILPPGVVVEQEAEDDWDGPTQPTRSSLPGALLRTRDGTTVPIGAALRIGRAKGNHLQIKDWNVSKDHAAIRNVGDGFVLEDLHSTNGTYVGGKRITEDTYLTHADVIRISDTELVFEIAAASGGKAPGNPEPLHKN